MELLLSQTKTGNTQGKQQNKLTTRVTAHGVKDDREMQGIQDRGCQVGGAPSTNMIREEIFELNLSTNKKRQSRVCRSEFLGEGSASATSLWHNKAGMLEHGEGQHS